jgi:putative peptidoglycan lipid II flippase
MSETDASTSGSASLLRSSGIMAAGTVVSRLLGFVRISVLAAAIGIRTVGDTFAVANTVPNIIYILLAGGVLNAVFVPQLVRAMKDRDGGQAYADRLLTLSSLVLAAVTVAATLAAPLIVRIYVGGRLDAEDVALATMFAVWCLPQIFFYGLYTMLGQVLNARGSFGPMMWAPVLNNLVAIAVGIAFILTADVDFLDSGSVSAAEVALLAGGTTLGVALQALVLLPVLRRRGFRWRLRFDFRGAGLGKAGNLAKWTLLFVLVNQLAYLVVVRLATSAGKAATLAHETAANYVAYANGYLVLMLPHSIVTVSVVTALLPRMSTASAEGRLGDLRDDISTGWRLTAVVLVPSAVAMLVLGPDLTTVLFSGAGIADARFAGHVVQAFAFGLLPFSMQYLALRAFYAQENTRTPFLVQCWIAGINVVLAVAAAAVLPSRWAVVGIAGAYSLTYVIGLAISLAVLRRRTQGLDGRRVLRTYLRLGVAGAIAGVLAALANQAVLARLGQGFSGSLAGLAIGGAVLGGAFLLGALAMRVAELTALLGLVRGRIG